MSGFINMFINGDDYFEQIRDEKVLLWGGGTKGRQTLKILHKMHIIPLAIIDNDSKKWGTDIDGILIISYEEAIKQYKGCTILITTVWTYAKDIRKQLKGWKVFVCANPFKTETKFLNMNEILDDENNLKRSYELLEDQKSKEIFKEVINWKITGDASLPAIYTDEESFFEWFDFEGIDYSNTYTYVDVGAYTGDTVVRFMLRSGFKYEKIIAIEPDKRNGNVMMDIFEKLRMNKAVTYIEEGVWSEKTHLEFFHSGADIYESSNFIQSIDNMICIARQENADCGISEIVAVNTLDNILQKETGRILIKIDAQGSEYEALIGTKDTIINKKPILIMEYATHSKHIGDIIPYLHSLNNKYKFYLRQKLLTGNSRTVLYVV